MKEKVKLIFFEPGQKAGHGGETFVAEAKYPGVLRAGCAFNKRGEPCRSHRGWVCIDILGKNNVIFKKYEKVN